MKYSDPTLTKIRLYFASNYLYAKGKSHPEIVTILMDHGYEKELATEIADQAMKDLWQNVYNQTQELFAAGKTYDEVFQEVKHVIPDEEVTYFIIDSWYQLQTEYVDNLIESRTNIDEGLTYFILSLIGFIVIIYIGLSMPAKIVWGLCTIGQLIRLLHGIVQKRESKKLEEILTKDYSKFSDFI